MCLLETQLMCVCSVSEAFRRFLFSCSISLYHCGLLSAAAPNWMLAERNAFFLTELTVVCLSGVTRPKVSVLPPSSAEISSKKTATLVCVASKGFPSDWSLSWKVDGSSRSQESSAGLLEKDGLYSWSSSLTLSEQEWMESVSVSCEATRSGQPALTGHVTRQQCSE
uniref:Ig-like domain-containing protein n=1 Tax=Cyprinus carpio TaxID=7962 RepID=A0A8C1XTQ9_CYPCA